MSRDRASRRFYRVDSNYELLRSLDRGELASYQNRWTFEVENVTHLSQAHSWFLGYKRSWERFSPLGSYGQAVGSL
jgi:hypothetical protein